MPHIGYFPVPAFPRPLAIPPSAFGPPIDTQDWTKDYVYLRNRVEIIPQNFYAPVFLPNKATITKVWLLGYIASSADVITLYLYRNNRAGTEQELCSIVSNWMLGFGGTPTTTISYPVIDNENYDYCALAVLDPETQPGQCMLTGVKIEWK